MTERPKQTYIVTRLTSPHIGLEGPERGLESTEPPSVLLGDVDTQYAASQSVSESEDSE